jgi:hypothetical protein
MAYKVVWLRDSFTIGTEQYDDLGQARDRALGHLKQMHTSFGVTAVKVVDDKGKPHFLNSLGGR